MSLAPAAAGAIFRWTFGIRFGIIRPKQCAHALPPRQAEKTARAAGRARKERLGPEMKELTMDDFDAETAQGVVLVDFWAPWCGPCKMMGAVLEQQVAPQAEAQGVKIAKVNVDDEPELAARFGVQSIPALLILKDGAEKQRLTGVQRAPDLIAALNAAAG